MKCRSLLIVLVPVVFLSLLLAYEKWHEEDYQMDYSKFRSAPLSMDEEGEPEDRSEKHLDMTFQEFLTYMRDNRPMTIEETATRGLRLPESKGHESGGRIYNIVFADAVKIHIYSQWFRPEPEPLRDAGVLHSSVYMDFYGDTTSPLFANVEAVFGPIRQEYYISGRGSRFTRGPDDKMLSVRKSDSDSRRVLDIAIHYSDDEK